MRASWRAFAGIVVGSSLFLAASSARAERIASAELPIVVEYERPDDAALAATALASAEKGWRRLVGELGYPAPWTGSRGETPRVGMTVLVAPTGLGPGTATANPKADVAATPMCDCSATLTIDRETRNDASAVDETLFHELVHTMQYASECTATPSAYEGFAVAAQAKEFPASSMVRGVVAQFQAFPERSVDHWTMHMPCDGKEPCFPYQLGAALFPLFLVDRFEGGDPRALPRIFSTFAREGTTQMGIPSPSCTGVANDWLGAVRRFVERHGTTFYDAFEEFSVWRATTGSSDDGAHFAGGRSLPPVKIAAVHDARAPFEGALDAHELGSRYVEIENVTEAQRLRVEIVGAGGAAWRANVLSFRAGSPVVVTPIRFEGDRAAATVTFPDRVARAVLVVTHLDDGSHAAEAVDTRVKRRFVYAASPEGAPSEPERTSAPPSGGEVEVGGCHVAALGGHASRWDLVAAVLGCALLLGSATRRALGREAKVAERKGFEPLVGLHRHMISNSQATTTTTDVRDVASGLEDIGGRSSELQPLPAAASPDPVEVALADAITKATEECRFDVVAQLARELSSRRHDKHGVVQLQYVTRATRRRAP